MQTELIFHILFMMEEELQTDENSKITHPKRRRHLKSLERKQSANLDQTSTLKLLDTQFEIERQCRICLEQADSRENPLVSPCRCTGSVKYVHDLCYKKWIERLYFQKTSQDRIIFLKDGIQCELCRMKFSIEYKYNNICCVPSHFCRQYNQSLLIFYLYMVFFLVDLGCIGFLLGFMATQQINLQKSHAVSLVIIIGLVFLTIILSIVAYYFCKDYFVQRVWELLGYKEKVIQIKGGKNKIAPLDASIN